MMAATARGVLGMGETAEECHESTQKIEVVVGQRYGQQTWKTKSISGFGFSSTL